MLVSQLTFSDSFNFFFLNFHCVLGMLLSMSLILYHLTSQWTFEVGDIVIFILKKREHKSRDIKKRTEDDIAECVTCINTSWWCFNSSEMEQEIEE
jgi:hypothetical protein